MKKILLFLMGLCALSICSYNTAFAQSGLSQKLSKELSQIMPADLKASAGTPTIFYDKGWVKDVDLQGENYSFHETLTSEETGECILLDMNAGDEVEKSYKKGDISKSKLKEKFSDSEKDEDMKQTLHENVVSGYPNIIKISSVKKQVQIILPLWNHLLVMLKVI